MNQRQFKRLVSTYQDGASHQAVIHSILDICNTNEQSTIWVGKFFDFFLESFKKEIHGLEDRIDKKNEEIHDLVTRNDVLEMNLRGMLEKGGKICEACSPMPGKLIPVTNNGKCLECGEPVNHLTGNIREVKDDSSIGAESKDVENN